MLVFDHMRQLASRGIRPGVVPLGLCRGKRSFGHAAQYMFSANQPSVSLRARWDGLLYPSANRTSSWRSRRRIMGLDHCAATGVKMNSAAKGKATATDSQRDPRRRRASLGCAPVGVTPGDARSPRLRHPGTQVLRHPQLPRHLVTQSPAVFCVLPM
jgi:hypothetical protein